MPYSVKSVLWLLIDIFSLICLYYVIYTITGVPKFDLDTRIGRASVVLISLIFWLILIIKFSIRKDIREAIRQQQIFALSSLISILSVFIQNIFQELIAKFLFPEWYDLIPCTAEELEVSGIIFSRYIILSIFLLITTAALSFSISYLCISRKGKKNKETCWYKDRWESWTTISGWKLSISLRSSMRILRGRRKSNSFFLTKIFVDE